MTEVQGKSRFGSNLREVQVARVRGVYRDSGCNRHTPIGKALGILSTKTT